MGRSSPQCHRLPRHCRPYSQHPRHSASAGGCSGHSCTGTGPYHSGGCSLSRLSRRHSHGPHHTSSAQRCSGHWHRKTHSQSRAEVCSSPRPSYLRSRCRSHIANGLGHSGCFCSGTGMAHRCAHHTLPWARLNHPHSHLLRHTSSVRGCSGQNPCSGTHPLHRSFGYSWQAHHCRPHSHYPCHRPRREGCSAW